MRRDAANKPRSPAPTARAGASGPEREEEGPADNRARRGPAWGRAEETQQSPPPERRGCGGRREEHGGREERGRWQGKAESAEALIGRYLGPGSQEDGELVWRPTAFGRPALVYLHTDGLGGEAVTTLDSARHGHEVLVTIDVAGAWGIPELERELRWLTTHRTADATRDTAG